MNVFKHYIMTSLITQKNEIIISNILISKVRKREKIGESSTDGNSNQDRKILGESNSLKLARCSFDDEEIKFSGSTAIQRPLILCIYYLDGKCYKGNSCKRLNLCKEFLINFNKCPNNICQFGFSHDPFVENNSRIITSKWTDCDPKRIISFLRDSFPHLCKNYQKEYCHDENCKKLHICEDYLCNICKSNDCCLSHKITDEHCSKVFKRYNLVDLSNRSMAYVLPNILISKRLVSASESGIIAYKNLRKTSQTSSRKSLSKSHGPILGSQDSINSSHLASRESILFSNKEKNITFASDDSIFSSNEKNNVVFASDESISSLNEKSNFVFTRDVSISSSND